MCGVLESGSLWTEVLIDLRTTFSFSHKIPASRNRNYKLIIFSEPISYPRQQQFFGEN